MPYVRVYTKNTQVIRVKSENNHGYKIKPFLQIFHTVKEKGLDEGIMGTKMQESTLLYILHDAIHFTCIWCPFVIGMGFEMYCLGASPQVHTDKHSQPSCKIRAGIIE